ncbi:MAG: FAD-dependent oxidoreductase [Deltaproteobacteria bacterium]|nr:FAD-dependent oxidoreductase [Deltaproteobacteria bacterium]
MAETGDLKGPDLAAGIPAADLAEGGVVLGHVDGEAVLVARRGTQLLAVAATCTHYGGPLADGLLDDDTVRCPWHHACFSLRTGEALAAPALKPLACWEVEQRGTRIVVTGRSPVRTTARAPVQAGLASVVIVGGGAAGHAAAEMLRREGYAGALTLLSADPAAPYDRPNLSKDYLAGTAPEDWIPLRPAEFFQQQRIDLVTGVRVTRIDVARRCVETTAGRTHPFDALLLATGSEPVRLTIPGADLPHVHHLRTLADSRALITALGGAQRAVVVGASFIGLEVAASLRARNLQVSVVGREARPLERVLGPQLGDFIRSVHEQHGVIFHLGQSPRAIEAGAVVLESGRVLPADVVVVGIGVRPAVALAQEAGLAVDGGVLVDPYLQTRIPGIYAAGDIARWPDPHSGRSIRVEHWVVAQRHGQLAARNMLRRREPCTLVPFFWSQHYDVTIAYVGHAETWDRIVVDGSLQARDATVTFLGGDRTLAVATVGRDLVSLRAQVMLEGQHALAS